MGSTIIDNKRVIKNTMLLSVRMILVMIVSLYTVRIVLQSLGVVDYGLNNVIGGTVTLFTFLSRTMANASQRFFAFELGQDQESQMKGLFQTNITIYLALALFVFLLSATVGFWFLNTQMVIPASRINAANWIFILSVISFVLRLLATPYQAVLIAREKMSLFAWLSIVEAAGLLLIAFVLGELTCDRLISYGFFVFILNLIICFLYAIICRLRFDECRFGINTDREQLKKLLGFTGWSLYGSFASILKNNGINILLNVFFGPAINAARGIAYHAYNAIYSLVSNFSVALSPQIVKDYAAGERESMMTLVFRGSKMCYFIMLMLTLPVMLQTSYIFHIWLKDVPEYTILFSQLILIMAIIDTTTMPVTAAIDATGEIKRYQLIVGSVQFSIIPISYIYIKFGGSAYSPMIISIIISAIAFVLRIYIAHKSYGLSISKYFSNVLLRLTGVTAMAYLIAIGFIYIYDGAANFVSFVIISTVCVVSVVIAIWIAGLDTAERSAIKKFISHKLKSANNLH